MVLLKLNSYINFAEHDIIRFQASNHDVVFSPKVNYKPHYFLALGHLTVHVRVNQSCKYKIITSYAMSYSQYSVLSISYYAKAII